MTVEEYAIFEKENGTDLVRVDGIWWKNVRPFFYQPLFPFLEIVPGSIKVPHAALVGAYQHVVPSPEMANSQKNYFVWDDLRNYSLQKINHQRRYNIKKGMKFFKVEEIENMHEFISAGHPVYCSFYERTKYSFRKERVDKRYFADWAATLFRFPKIKILGAYRGGELSAISVSYLVDDVVIEATCFGRTEDLKDHVLDVLAHGILERAANCPEVNLIFRGTATGFKNIDDSKIRRGCRLISKPAYYHMNLFVYMVLRGFMKNNYDKIIGVLRDRDPAAERFLLEMQNSSHGSVVSLRQNAQHEKMPESADYGKKYIKEN